MTTPRPKYDLSRAEHDYPSRNGPPARTILLCSHPRSGSTLLAEALYHAGGLGCALEYFHAGFRPDFDARWGSRTLDQLRAALWRHRTDPGATLAVKLFWRDVCDIAEEADPEQFAGFAHILPDAATPATYRALAGILRGLFPDPRYLYLDRRDRLRQAISGLVAMQTDFWRDIGAGSGPAAGEIRYDFDQISALVANSDFSQAHWRNFFAANGITPYAMTYEDLSADYHRTVAALLEHLGCPAAVPEPRMRRQADAATAAMMARYLRDQRLSRA